MSIIDSVYEGGRRRSLACLPRETKCGDGTFPVFAEAAETPPLIPPDRWPQYEGRGLLRPHVWMTKNQASQNSCTATMGAGVLMGARAVSGLPKVEISQATTYGLGNGGSDGGMAVDRAFEIMRDVGCVPVSVVEQYNWRGRPAWPDDWREIAKGNRIIEGYDLPTLEHLVSAVHGGWFCGFGVYWSRRSGHAIAAVDHRGSETQILNSWGPEWGENGFGWLPDRQVERGIEVFGAWAVRVTTDPTNEGDV